MVPSAKRSLKYRFYPTRARSVELSRTVGCVRRGCGPAPPARAEDGRGAAVGPHRRSSSRSGRAAVEQEPHA
ncbi:helix-turn-helix domain-containing protein [Streptomyces venezuelae]|uniref:helix-turn-helix domain-containing protein n=1 Tax=Streptomyces venezuelae TaxID=54571 RepID=UPI001CC231CB